MWAFNTVDCLIELTAWACLTICYINYKVYPLYIIYISLFLIFSETCLLSQYNIIKLDDLPAIVPYVTKMTLILFAKKQEAMPMVINELPNKMETLQLDRLIAILASGPENINKKITTQCFSDFRE